MAGIRGLQMFKKILLILIAAFNLFFLVAGSYHIWHSSRHEAATLVPENIKVTSISKDSYEVLDDGTVLIYCTYNIWYWDPEAEIDKEVAILSGEEPADPEPVTVSIGGIFYNEKGAGFLEENILIADGTYTLEHGTTTTVQVVFEGHHGTRELMPDKLPPKPYIFICEPAEV